MEELYHEGVFKAIGVCNCSKEHLDPLLEKAWVKPMVNQMLIHPGMLLEEDMIYC